MIAGNDLDETGTRVAEDAELMDQVQEPASLEHALDQHAHLRASLGGDLRAIRRSPGHEAFLVRGERAGPCRQAIGGDEQRVGPEQGRNLRFTGLKLIVGPGESCVLATGVLEFDYPRP